MKPVDQNTFDELRSNAERLFTEMKVRLDKADRKQLATEKKYTFMIRGLVQK